MHNFFRTSNFIIHFYKVMGGRVRKICRDRCSPLAKFEAIHHASSESETLANSTNEPTQQSVFKVATHQPVSDISRSDLSEISRIYVGKYLTHGLATHNLYPQRCTHQIEFWLSH